MSGHDEGVSALAVEEASESSRGQVGHSVPNSGRRNVSEPYSTRSGDHEPLSAGSRPDVQVPQFEPKSVPVGERSQVTSDVSESSSRASGGLEDGTAGVGVVENIDGIGVGGVDHDRGDIPGERCSGGESTSDRSSEVKNLQSRDVRKLLIGHSILHSTVDVINGIELVPGSTDRTDAVDGRTKAARLYEVGAIGETEPGVVDSIELGGCSEHAGRVSSSLVAESRGHHVGQGTAGPDG